jgi:alpha-L-rhamnosidase
MQRYRRGVITLVPHHLRCESLIDPLAIQTAEPRFSWKLKTDSTETGLIQGGFRIIVASSEERARALDGDLWDSGRTASRETFGIRYAGRTLGSKERAWWRVQVWDGAGRASDWSPIARFAVGLLRPEDWTAEWLLGLEPIPAPNPFEGAQWIWARSGEPGRFPAGRHSFVRNLDLAAGAPLSIWLSADDSFQVFVNGAPAGELRAADGWKQPQSIDLSRWVREGSNEIRIEAANASEGPAGLIASLESGGRRWTTGPDWRADGGEPMALGPFGIQPWGRIGPFRPVQAPAAYLRRSFRPRGPVARATAYASALGIIDLEINGSRVSDDLFTPGWTDYRKRVHYRAYDVTGLVAPQTEVTAVLGQGWFSGYVAWGGQRDHYGRTPMARVQIEVEYEDGSSEAWATDESWTLGRGPIRDEHFLHGEAFDARAGFEPIGPAQVGAWSAPLEAFPGDPVQVEARVAPVFIRKAGEKRWIIDFGQNLAGFVRLRLTEKAGTEAVIRHAERLDERQELYTDNLRLAQATDRYTCRGGGEEWSPRFTFHGFQYAEISGIENPPTAESIEALSITSAARPAGTLITSDPMLNQLVSNAWWTQKMNFIDVPTDCPQRDERLGWTGDAQVYIRTAAYFADVQPFFTKWLETLDDAQRDDGNYPKVAPVLAGLDDGGPAWAEAGVICPMEAWRAYGDRDLLERSYPQMKRYLEFLVARSGPDLMPPADFHCYGDWLSINAATPNEVIYSAYFALTAQLVADAAQALGRLDEAERFRVLHRRLARAFQEAYVDQDGVVKGATQCGWVLALAFDLLDEDLAAKAADHLVKDIESRGWHLSTGFVGTRDVMHVLVKIGRPDIAWRLLHNTTFPSWGFPIMNGATSIWERWDGWTPEKGFQDPGMNSFAHYAYGAVAGWMFEHIGGISPMEPGYGRVLIAPLIDPKLTHAEARYDSVRGPILVSWRVEGGQLKLEVELPPNTSGLVRVPGKGGVEIGSGRHAFTAAWPAT